MEKILAKKGFICDMDGVIYHGNKILDGVADFVNWMLANDKKFVFFHVIISEQVKHTMRN